VSFYLVLQQAPPPTIVAQSRVSVDSIPLVLDYVDIPSIRRFKALSPEEQFRVMRERGIHYLPYLALGLVPIYAALLGWVYRARRRRYRAHLAFGLYAHAFFLLIFVIEARLPLLLATMLSIWAIVYCAIALQRVYGGTWTETIGRGALLTVLYALTVLAIGLPVTAVLLSV